MTTSVLSPPVWVDTPENLARLVADLSAQPVIAVDTESNSLHAYREQVCLIQFSTPATDYVLDPLAVSPEQIQALTPIFANPSVEKIFHAAEYDLICLNRDFGWDVRGLFDTMIAVRTLGWPQNGLASVLESEFGVKLNKRHQRADWAARPLSVDQIAYARLDTHFLIPLRNRVAGMLKEAGFWDEAQEEFERLCQVNGRAAHSEFDPQNFWYITGARDLTPRQAAILRELYVYRDQVASRLNRPPFKVMAEATLLEIAKAQPRQLDDLKPIVGMTANQLKRHGHHLLQVVARGHTAPHPRPLRVAHEDEVVLERYEALRKWRKQRAQGRGVESDIIIPRDVLRELARRAPQSAADLAQVPGLGPARRAKYGEEILGVLKRKPLTGSDS